MNRSANHLKIKNNFTTRKSQNHATAHRVISSQWLGFPLFYSYFMTLLTISFPDIIIVF